MTPDAAAKAALREGQSVLRPVPRCPWCRTSGANAPTSGSVPTDESRLLPSVFRSGGHPAHVWFTASTQMGMSPSSPMNPLTAPDPKSSSPQTPFESVHLCVLHYTDPKNPCTSQRPSHLLSPAHLVPPVADRLSVPAPPAGPPRKAPGALPRRNRSSTCPVRQSHLQIPQNREQPVNVPRRRRNLPQQWWRRSRRKSHRRSRKRGCLVRWP